MHGRSKLFLVVLLMLLMAALPVGVVRGQYQPLTFTAPVNGTVWTAGSTVTIQWIGGDASWSVNLALIDVPSWTTAMTIATNIPNSGSYTWTIPGTLPPSTYEVYIEEVGKKEWAYSGDVTVPPVKDRPDLTISKKPTGELVAGQQATYQVVVSNMGTAPAAGPIVVTDTLGAGLTFVAAAGTGWTCSALGQTVTCTHPGPLGASQSLPPIALTVAVADGVDGVENCAAVAMNDTADHPGEDNLENNRTCVKSPVAVGKPGSLCGVKFHDLDGDGVRDPGEPGLSGWTIEIRDAAGNLVATVVTGAQGRYCVDGLKPGAYAVSEVLKPGWTQTYPAGSGIHSVTVASGATAGPVQFGNRPATGRPCCLDFTFTGGRPDRFQTADGPEPTSPPPGAPAAVFDETQIDRRFDHRFTLPAGNCIRQATLVVRARPLWSTLSNNDTISLSTGSGPAAVWSTHFGSGTWGPGLTGNPWTQANYPAGQTFTLNLASLPGGGNLLATLDSNRFLDLGIQDDTSVDYAELRVQFCECSDTAPGGGPGRA